MLLLHYITWQGLHMLICMHSRCITELCNCRVIVIGELGPIAVVGNGCVWWWEGTRDRTSRRWPPERTCRHPACPRTQPRCLRGPCNAAPPSAKQFVAAHAYGHVMAPSMRGGRRPSSSGRTSNNSFTCASMAKSHATTRARWPLLRTAVAVRSACGAPPHRCPVTASRQPVYARAVCHGGRRWVFGSSHGVNLIVIARVGSLDAFAHLFFVLVVAVSEYHVRTLHCEMLCGGPVETKCHRVPRSYAAAWRLCARALDR